MKTLFVGDLHLLEKELSTTKGMIETSTQMLEGIKNVLLSDPEIKMVVFEGDIQHATPKSKRTLRETTIWKTILGEIGSIVLERIPKYSVINRADVNENKLPYKPLPLFTVKGNHDVEKTMRSKLDDYNYTFFDDLLYTGTLQNPRGFMFKDAGKVYYIQLNNYGEVAEPIDSRIKELGNEVKTIKVLHDTIKAPSSPTWFNVMAESDYYVAEKVLGDCDLAICGHIHEPLAPVKVQGDGTLGTKSTVFMQTGSMGRTSFTDENMRDYGYCTLVDTTDGIKVSELKIPLMPVTEYFNWKQINLNETKKEAIRHGQMFNLNFERTNLVHTDPKEDVENLTLDSRVKENTIKAIEHAEEN